MQPVKVKVAFTQSELTKVLLKGESTEPEFKDIFIIRKINLNMFFSKHFPIQNASVYVYALENLALILLSQLYTYYCPLLSPYYLVYLLYSI